MAEKRKKYDQELGAGAVRIVEETNKPIAQVARDAGCPGRRLPGTQVARDLVGCTKDLGQCLSDREDLFMPERRRKLSPHQG